MSEAKRTGRPFKAPEPGERIMLGFRVTADMKTKIVAAAHATGRSLSQEVEFRLERSFREDDLIAAFATLGALADRIAVMEDRLSQAGQRGQNPKQETACRYPIQSA